MRCCRPWHWSFSQLLYYARDKLLVGQSTATQLNFATADLAGQALPAEAADATSQAEVDTTSGRSRLEAEAAAAAQAFACWAHNPPPELPWEAVDDFVMQHLPQLLRVTWMVPAHQDMEALRCGHCTRLSRSWCPGQVTSKADNASCLDSALRASLPVLGVAATVVLHTCCSPCCPQSLPLY